MNILVPKNVFLRVEDKFVPSFIDSDQAVATSPTLLYRKLFAECYATGKCRLPQKFLAGQCKFSVRTLQYAQARLVELGYIHVEHTPGECSSYILLLSDRVKKLLVADDLIDQRRKSVPQIQTPPQNLRGGCAKPAHPSYKEDKREKSSPLSPTRRQTASQHPPLASHSQAQYPSLTRKPVGGGILLPEKNRKATHRRSRRPMPLLSASTRHIRARKPRSRPAPYGTSFGGAGRFLLSICCCRRWIASGPPRLGTGNMAALFLTS